MNRASPAGAGAASGLERAARAAAKEPGALRTIGEVADALGIRQHVLRYWEEQFPMLRPLKRSGGRRYYRPEDVALVARINALVHERGFTLRGARQALQGAAMPAPESAHAVQPGQGSLPLLGDAPPPVLPPASPTSATANEALRGRLAALRSRLAAALD